jgi:CDP-diacylglycerol--glycerol-3-phosphate 3-phosphatidyltransferase
MLLGGLFDALDGEVARVSDRGSDFGAFLDSTLDRFSEAAIFGGIVFLFAESGRPLWSLLAVAALAFSFLTSYTRARAEGLGYECKLGLMERAHRVILLAALSIAGFVGAGVALVATGALITTLQRILHIRGSSRLSDR